jgi:hypothetical protein
MTFSEVINGPKEVAWSMVAWEDLRGTSKSNNFKPGGLFSVREKECTRDQPAT